MARLEQLASLALAGYSLYYLFLCVAFPFGRCRRCAGTGLRRARLSRSLRDCRRCHHTGLRLRVGRRVYEFLRTEHQRGHR